MFSQVVIATDFAEYPVADPAIGRIHHFDIPICDSDLIHSGDFGTSQYCNLLVEKIFTLAHFEVMPFLRFQCSQLDDPKGWLLSLENLLHTNNNLFNTWHEHMIIEMVMIFAAMLFQEVDSGKFRRVRKYNISEVKKQLMNLKTSVDQIAFLYEIKTEYLQDRTKIVDYSEAPFDQLISLEIERIEQLRASFEKIRNRKPLLKSNLDEELIDNNEFLLKMNISRRTAQAWRDKALINFYPIGSKIYYRLADVELMLQKKYVKSAKK
jgi:hypothetical protein